MEPLPKEITDEIRFILEGCRDGRLEHDQQWYHCGTSHCIAGWKVALDYKKQNKRKKFVHDGSILNDFAERNCDVAYRDEEWAYATDTWGLTDSEAYTLFRSFAPFEEQFALLEMLERGERLT